VCCLPRRGCGPPAPPRCGELLTLPEYPEFAERGSGVEIRHVWQCDGCDNRFDTLIRFKAVA
jgi:hypothetical protein